MTTIRSHLCFVLVLVLVLVALVSAARAGKQYGPTIFMDDVSVGAWSAPSNLAVSAAAGGTYTNGYAVTNWYRLAGTNLKGRVAASSNVVCVLPVDTNGTNAIRVAWPRYDGLTAYILERSRDAGSTWTNWLRLGPAETNLTDTGTNAWAATSWSNGLPLIPAPSVPWGDLAYAAAAGTSVYATAAGSAASADLAYDLYVDERGSAITFRNGQEMYPPEWTTMGSLIVEYGDIYDWYYYTAPPVPHGDAWHYLWTGGTLKMNFDHVAMGSRLSVSNVYADTVRANSFVGDGSGLTGVSADTTNAVKAALPTWETDPLAVLADGSREMTGDLNMGGNPATNVGSLYLSDGGASLWPDLSGGGYIGSADHGTPYLWLNPDQGGAPVAQVFGQSVLTNAAAFATDAQGATADTLAAWRTNSAAGTTNCILPDGVLIDIGESLALARSAIQTELDPSIAQLSVSTNPSIFYSCGVSDGFPQNLPNTTDVQMVWSDLIDEGSHLNSTQYVCTASGVYDVAVAVTMASITDQKTVLLKVYTNGFDTDVNQSTVCSGNRGFVSCLWGGRLNAGNTIESRVSHNNGDNAPDVARSTIVIRRVGP